MTKLSKYDLEQMLSFLDINTLELIDSQRRQDAPYTFGSRPLLKYSVEALREYASAIYRYILPHFGSITVTESEYTALWLAPYINLQTELTSKADSFISQLRNIAETPTETEPNTLPPMTNRVYAEIVGYLSGKNDDLYADIIDYMTSTSSPLRRDTVTDQRVLDLIAEVDAMRATGNKVLIAFIGTQLTLTQQATAAVYGRSVPQPKYGTELSRLRQPVLDRLAYYNLNHKTIELITAYKSRISAEDWATISQALDSKVITKEVKDIIKASKKAIKQAMSESPLEDTDEVDTITTNDAFICNFLPRLEQAYSEIKPTTTATLDDIFADIDAVYIANEQDMSFDAIQDQQKSTEAWYYNYLNISKSLTASLQIVLNDIAPNTVLSSDVLSNGAVQGTIAFAEQVKKQLNSGTRDFDYDKLAQELRHQLRVHTAYFTDTAPIPELVTTGREQLLNAQESTVQQAKLADTSFDITKSIQHNLNVLRPTIVLTECKEIPLSPEEIQSLVPVPDLTITELLLLSVGKGTTPYLLRGDLLAQTKDGIYLKIIPTKNEGYVSYKFTAINGKALNFLINKYCELLQVIPEYSKLIGYYKDTNDEIFGIAPQYDYDAEDSIDTVSLDAIDDDSISTLQEINDLLKARMKSTQTHLSLSDLSERLDSQASCYWEDDTLYKCLASTVKGVYKELGLKYHVPYIKYYDPPYYISGHYLAKWIYDPAEYTEKITNGNGAYSIDHNEIGEEYRSDNSRENLSIKPKPYNSGRTSRSIKVNYKGEPFVSLSDYCTKTNAGNADNLLDLKDALQLGESKEYNHRIYTKVNENQLTVTDAESKASEITFNGESYSNLKAFADELKFTKRDYDALRQGIGRARRDGKIEYTYRHKGKKYTFYLDANGNTKITL